MPHFGGFRKIYLFFIDLTMVSLLQIKLFAVIRLDCPIDSQFLVVQQYVYKHLYVYLLWYIFILHRIYYEYYIIY